MSGSHLPFSLSVRQFRDGNWREMTDSVSAEVPVRIRWSGPDIPVCEGTLWAWPEALEEAALGHVLLEHSGRQHWLGRRQASIVRTGGEDTAPQFAVTLGADGSLPGSTPVLEAPVWDAPALLHAMDAFIGAEGLWDSTGCFHRAGVYSVEQGKLLHRAEDIGRHNCVDRLAGWAALHQVPLGDKVLLVSARLTRSLCVKALYAGFRFLVSRSAVTTASIAEVEQAGATLVGFARTREGRFTVFADHARRIR